MSNQSANPDQLQFIQLRGSSTVLKLMQKIGMRYMDEHPHVHLPLIGGGTAMGYKSALDGTCTIGMASGQIPPNIQLWANKHKLSIEEVTIATDGIAAIVNRANPINGLTLEQLHDVFTGNITDWSSLGKYSGPINVISHDPQLGTYEPWKRQVAGAGHITLKAKVVQNFNGLLQAITSDPFSIGYIGTTFLDGEKMKPLSINGVFPTYKDIKQRRYPIRNELQLLIRSAVSKEAKDFIAYCLDKNAGQAIIKEMGLVPVLGE
jgi:phosphate transport system substrate-binding protein